MKKLIFALLIIPSFLFGQATGLELSNYTTNSSLGSAATTVDVATIFNFNQTTSGITVTVPNPTNTALARNMMFRNSTGSTQSVTLSPGGTLAVGTGVFIQWDGGQWVVMNSFSIEQLSNQILAAPDGSNGLPMFRALTGNDLPTSGVTAGSYGIVTVDSKGRATAGKRQELYTNTTNSSGEYSVTYGTAFGSTPDVQISLRGQTNSNQVVMLTASSTTGFTVKVVQRSTVEILGITVLSSSATNVESATVDVLVTER